MNYKKNYLRLIISACTSMKWELLYHLSRLALKIVVMTREQGRGFAVSVSRTVLGNFTFRYLCRFFSVHLLSCIF
ncbi:MAG: hypothetical protein ACK5S7_20170 [Dolichospermum sp.]